MISIECRAWFYISVRGVQHAFLNVVCHGTNFQVVELVEGVTARAVWEGYSRGWSRYFGQPEIAITDGGAEFMGWFEEALSTEGVYQHLINADCPWENSRAERHGGLIKDLLETRDS